MKSYIVDMDGWVRKDGESVNVNVFEHTGAMLMSGQYERSGFGMTPGEMEAAVSLGLFRD
jgi:hypothetical protein